MTMLSFLRERGFLLFTAQTFAGIRLTKPEVYDSLGVAVETLARSTGRKVINE